MRVQTARPTEFSGDNTHQDGIPTGFSTRMWIEGIDFRNITFRILSRRSSSTKIVAEINPA